MAAHLTRRDRYSICADQLLVPANHSDQASHSPRVGGLDHDETGDVAYRLPVFESTTNQLGQSQIQSIEYQGTHQLLCSRPFSIPARWNVSRIGIVVVSRRQWSLIGIIIPCPAGCHWLGQCFANGCASGRGLVSAGRIVKLHWPKAIGTPERLPVRISLRRSVESMGRSSILQSNPHFLKTMNQQSGDFTGRCEFMECR